MSIIPALLATPVPSFAVDSRRLIVVWNPACEAMLGHRASEVVGQPCYEVLGACVCSGAITCRRDCTVWSQVEQARPVLPFETEVCDGSGALRRVLCSVVTLSAAAPAVPRLIYQLHNPAGALDEQHDPFSNLSSRERSVLALLVQGRSAKEISEALGIRHATARNHLQNILRKLGVHSQLEAVSLAYRRNRPPAPGKV